MRSIESKKDIERRRKRNQIIVGLIMIFIMLGSTFAIIIDSLSNEGSKGNNKIEYNGYEFIENNGFWITKIGNYNFAFSYNPEQTSEIGGEFQTLDKYYGVPLYFSTESESAMNEIYRNLNGIVERTQAACIEEKECPEDWPIKDCSNNFIIIKESNESKIIQQDKCVFIYGESENLTQITDGFLFKIMGIKS